MASGREAGSGPLASLGCVEGDSRELRCFAPTCVSFLDMGSFDESLSFHLFGSDIFTITWLEGGALGAVLVETMWWLLGGREQRSGMGHRKAPCAWPLGFLLARKLT